MIQQRQQHTLELFQNVARRLDGKLKTQIKAFSILLLIGAPVVAPATPVKETMGSRFGKVVAKGKDFGKNVAEKAKEAGAKAKAAAPAGKRRRKAKTETCNIQCNRFFDCQKMACF